MDETFELLLTVVIFGVAALAIVGLMVYWSKHKTIVDERDRKYYKEAEDEKDRHS